MILCIAHVVAPGLLERIQKILPNERFADGVETAGWHAKLVKDNRQITRFSADAEKARVEFVDSLKKNDVFRSGVLPKTFRPLLFSRYEAGHVIVYPSTTVHRVEPVSQGVRDVAIGWLQSLVRDPAQREILFDLDTARRSLFQQHGKTREFDNLSKTYANLLRMWADV